MDLSRRQAIVLAGAGAASMAVPGMAAAVEPRLANLRVQQMDAPLGLDSPAPRLSWQMQGGPRDTVQKSYRIMAASSERLIRAGRYDLWDSGRVESARCFDIAYAGKPLSSRQAVFWRVQVEDGRGAIMASETSKWEMGLLRPDDWRGGWLACETGQQGEDRRAGLRWMDGAEVAAGTAVAFRMPFDLPQAAALTIYVGSNRVATATLDGEPLALPPRSAVAWGPPPVARVAGQAAAGRHVLGLVVEGGRPEARAQSASAAITIRASLADGRVRHFVSQDMATTGAPGAGWDKEGAAIAGWTPATPSMDQPQAWPGTGGFHLRRAFDATGEIASARLYATALGAYELFLNGSKVGDGLLAPECTDTRKRVYYRCYDVGAMLARGGNVIGATVADGWYGSYNSPTGRYAFGPPPLRFRGQLEITYVDGRREVIGTDERWQLSRAPVTMADIYDGEDYDARLEQPGWDRPGFSAGGDWLPAKQGDDPGIAVCAPETPPIRVTQALSARSIREVRPGVFVFDFGQNFAGLPRLSVRGRAGETVTLRFAEVLKPSGEIDQSNLRAARAADTYVLRGDPAGETYMPRFTYHGFRWVEVTGYPGRPTTDALQALVIHSDLVETSTLAIDSPVVQALWQNTLWSQRSNFVGLPTDCPQRDERLGWMGDANVFWDAASFNMNVVPFTRRFMRDVRDAQASNGAFAEYSPKGGRHEPDQSAPGWADAGVILPWTSYRRFGDTAVIDENWDAMTRYIDMIVRGNPDLLWRHQRGADFGDWLALDAKRPGDPTTPKDLVGTATFKHSVDAMRDMAAATGRRSDEARYRDLSAAIAAAFARAFVGADGTVGNGSQTGYILALNYGLVPPARRQAALARLVADIRRRGTLLSTGFLGTPGSLDCLADGNERALVYDLLLRTAYPSWGYMVDKGATTIWERWNGDTGDVTMNSFNHYALGAITGFVFRRIAGLTPLEPGFRRFLFDPVLDGRVRSCAATYQSVLGRIAVDWKRSADRFRLAIEVPGNGEAVIRLPVSAGREATEGGTGLDHVPGVTILSRDARRVEVRVGSGRYSFEA